MRSSDSLPIHISLLNVSARRSSLLLLFVLTSAIKVLANPPTDDSGCVDWWTWAGDKAPGVGYEFETEDLQFRNSRCNTIEGLDALKGKVVGGIGGLYWRLTADSSFANRQQVGVLVGEIILDGLSLKVGSVAAENTAENAAYDMITLWDPASRNGQQIAVQDSPYGLWRISTPNGRPTIGFIWYPQVTAALPLQCIQDLILRAVTGSRSWLLPEQPGGNLIAVKKEFFQSARTGVSPDDVTEDVLGFFSVVLSYAKNTDKLKENQRPKYLTSIMPRTDFTTMFNLIRNFITVDLYSLVKILACYEETSSGLEVDGTWCTGDVDDPEPTEEMNYRFFNAWTGNEEDDLYVSEWMNSIQSNQYPDKLTIFDQRYGGSQIGGRGNRMEYVTYTAVLAPLWEFRDLININTAAFKKFAQYAMGVVVFYHDAYKRSLGLESPV